MLTRLVVQGYKTLNDVSFEPGWINVFIGANGSGKTNLLEAVGLMSAAAGGRVDDRSLLARGVRAGVPALYKTSLRTKRMKPAIYLEGRWGSGEVEYVYKAGLNNPLSDPRPAWDFKTESLGGPKARSVLSRVP